MLHRHLPFPRLLYALMGVGLLFGQWHLASHGVEHALSGEPVYCLVCLQVNDIDDRTALPVIPVRVDAAVAVLSDVFVNSCCFHTGYYQSRAPPVA
ncbi:MAG: hypothetical protein OEZ39_17775 [Gammaproteobacteria bacterium]|nr:hypothetical protein [Gammaproteobacteria bacterium]MDH5653715.1 hypothetical protein [Gammaproteobacteria bacterium]